MANVLLAPVLMINQSAVARCVGEGPFQEAFPSSRGQNATDRQIGLAAIGTWQRGFPFPNHVGQGEGQSNSDHALRRPTTVALWDLRGAIYLLIVSLFVLCLSSLCHCHGGDSRDRIEKRGRRSPEFKSSQIH